MQLENSVISDLVRYIRQTNTPFAQWYVGIAEDPQARLFEEHRVNREMDYWIFKECYSADAARRVEQYFITNYHADGGVGGGSNASRFVYAYKKESYTVDTK